MKELVGLRRGGGSEVSDEHSTSLTVVLHDGKHQSQVIYSLPLAGTLPLFFLVMYVCKHQTKKQQQQETGQIAALIASLFLYPPPPPLCLSPSIQIRYACMTRPFYQSLSPTLPFLLYPFFFFMHALFPPSPCLLALRPSGVKCFVIVKRQP